MNQIEIDPVQLCRGFYLLAIAITVSFSAISPLRRRFVAYGPRTTDEPKSSSRSANSKEKDWLLKTIDFAAGLKVPHSWFIHFYITSVLSSIFWGYQLAMNGSTIRYVVSLRAINKDSEVSSMTLNQVTLTWLLMAFQGSRRLYECISLAKTSQSTMSFPAWILGIGFYSIMGICTWVEGIPALSNSDAWVESIVVSKPSIKTFVSISLFVLASGVQHDCHEYLASLKKYTLPQKWAFQWVLCPHYTSECLIYFSLAILAAPQDQLLNKTILTVLLFEAINLGITAESTRSWYSEKFGATKIQGRKRMIPFLY